MAKSFTWVDPHHRLNDNGANSATSQMPGPIKRLMINYYYDVLCIEN